MSKFRKKGKKGVPAVNTAALPDIVFMLLFFFMVTTVMKDASLKVKVVTPAATEIKKLEPKNLVKYIYIGEPVKDMQAAFGSAPRIQLNDAFADIDDIYRWVTEKRNELSERDKRKMIVAFKVDQGTNMGIVTETKQALREADALKISYSTKKTNKIAN